MCAFNPFCSAVYLRPCLEQYDKKMKKDLHIRREELKLSFSTTHMKVEYGKKKKEMIWKFNKVT